MALRLLRERALPVSPWPNGAGRKADIATGDSWLVAFAWLDADAPFSDYTGHDRTITLIDGHGFVLRFADGQDLTVPSLTPTRFDGGAKLVCHLPQGPCRVLNAMTLRGKRTNDVRIGAVEPADAEITVLVALDDSGVLRTGRDAMDLARWDAAVIEGPLAVSGEGLFATIRIGGVSKT
jgi:environmental stress-induced protein Ves